MHSTRRSFLMGTATAVAVAMTLPPSQAFAADSAITIGAPMDPPEWALLQRELLSARADEQDVRPFRHARETTDRSPARPDGPAEP